MKQPLLAGLLGLTLFLGACTKDDSSSEAPIDAPADAPADTAADAPAAAPVELVTAPAPDAAAADLSVVPSLGEGEQVTPSGLHILDTKVGDGVEAVLGKTVFVHYTGTLVDGVEFDSSLNRGAPLDFQLGTPNIIQGWNEGIAGMKVGGKRTLGIPSDLAYGADGRPPLIPGGAALMFTVELMDVK